MNKFTILFISFIFPLSIYSQFIEDALRYALPNGIINPRAAALGIAYNGIVDDNGSLFYNPAGLTLIKGSELSMGLNFTRNNAETSFLNSNELLKTNSEAISNLSIISSFIKNNKKIAVGIGYFRENDFFNSLKFNSLNPKSSIITTEVLYGPRKDDENWAYELYLADKVGNGYVSPYNDSLYQSGFVNERGGVHSVIGALGIDVNDNITLGISLIGKWGNYTYSRDYKEFDLLEKYKNISIEGYTLSTLNLKEDINQHISGISGSIGVVAKIDNFFRFTANIKFPTWYQFEENFSKKLNAIYTNQPNRIFEYDGKTSYNITTPFIYSAGASVHNMGLTFSAGVQYTDVSQLTFSDANSQVMDLNNIIIQELIGLTTWGLGLEYDFGILPFVARASYSKTSSPYSKDIPNAYKSNFAIGGSAYIGDNVRIDGVFRWTSFSELRTVYNDANGNYDYARYILNNSPLTISLGIVYRY
jgi:long-subunit fatty acid transport protein